MKKLAYHFLILFIPLNFFAQYKQSLSLKEDTHPRLFCTPNDRTATITKIKNQQWAKQMFEASKKQVDEALELYKKDPEQILGRMLMHRKKGQRYHKTIFYTENEVPGKGGTMNRQNGFLSFGNASVPTPVVSVGQSRKFINKEKAYVPYKKIKDWPMYAGKNGVFNVKVAFDKKGKETEKVTLAYNELFSLPHENYMMFFDLASEAAFIYWVTEDEQYAELASDIILFWCNGAQYMDLTYTPSNLKPTEELSIIKKQDLLGDKLRSYRTSIGRKKTDLKFFNSLKESGSIRHNPRWTSLTTEHPINAKELSFLAIAYDFLYPYLKTKGVDTKPVEITLKKMADAALFYGNGKGNINMMEGYSLLVSALPLERNSAYSDGKGVEFYIDHLLNKSQITENGYASTLSIGDHLELSHDKQTGMLMETFGYTGHLNWYLRVIFMLENNGISVADKYPQILQATYGKGDYLFPFSNRGPAYGDSGSHGFGWKNLEIAYAISDKIGDEAMENTISNYLKLNKNRQLLKMWRASTAQSILMYKEDLAIDENKLRELPILNQLYFSGTLVQRNLFKDKHNAMMGVMYGARIGHGHENGLALEMYNKGHVFSVDALALEGLNYRSNFTSNFTIRFAAHNTVLVNSASYTMKGASRAVYTEPTTDAYTSISPNYSFAKMYYDENTTESDHLRTLGIVKSEKSKGFYVDVFRSKTRNNNDVTHDYIYHNAGRNSMFLDQNGVEISLKDKIVLKDKSKDKPAGYSLLNKQATSGLFENDFRVQYEYQYKETAPDRNYMKQPKEAWGTHYVTNMWQLGNKNRELVKVKGQALWKDQPNHRFPHESMTVVRQHGEAWNHPFVAVYETFEKSKGQEIKSVQRFPLKKSKNSSLVALDIKMNTEYNHIVLDCDDVAQEYSDDILTFKGAYAVITNRANLLELYLGKGTKLGYKEYEIKSHLNKLVSGTIEQLNELKWKIKVDSATSIRLPVSENSEIEVADLSTKLHGINRYYNKDNFSTLTKEVSWKKIKYSKSKGLFIPQEGEFLVRVVSKK